MDRPWLKHYPKHISAELEISDKSLPAMLKETIANFGESKAIHFYGEEITYRRLGELADAFTAALQEEGLKKGDRVAIMLPNCPQYVISYYGILQAGGIVTQLNPMLVGKELEYILADSGAETVVLYEPLLPALNKVMDKTSVKHVIKVNIDGRETDDGMTTGFQAFLQKTASSPVPVLIDGHDDIAILQYTGGTTGRSKGAMLTHSNLLANVMQSYEYFQDAFSEGSDRVLSVIPLFHVYGMSSCMNLTIYRGAMMILLPRFDPEEVMQTIRTVHPTSFPGVPTMYIALLNHPNIREGDLNSIGVCNSGSAPMPGEIMRSFESKTGATVLEGYGLSETSPSTHCNPYFGPRKAGSVGIGLPSTDYKIMDLAEGEEELPPGEIGEIVIKGPQVMKGYWNMPEETEQSLRDGWFYTGDIAYMDEDGYLFIVDRKKDLIIAGGFNIYPRDVEEIIYEHPAIQEAVVVGVPDPYRGETVKAVVVLKEGQICTAEELIAYCRENMAAFKVPKIVEFRDEMPKTNVGKILRRKIREESVQTD